MSKRVRAAALTVSFVTACTAASAFAQSGGVAGAARNYPERPIRLVVPFAPAGAADLFARTVAQRLREAWKQEVIVENRGGAGGNIGMAYVAKAAPDGYTLVLGNVGVLAINPALYKEVPYDSLRSFEPISLFGGTPLLLVAHPSVPAKNMKELIALARAHPGKLNFASAGTGGPTHLAGEMLNSVAGIKIVHVPYKGNVAALTALVSGETHMMITTIMTPLPFMQTGRLRGIAVATPKRQPAVPDIPTTAEAGVPGFEVSGWYGFLAPAGTPPDIIARLNGEIVRLASAPATVDQFAKQGLEIFGSTPEDFSAKIKAELARWGKLVRETRASVD